MNSNQILIYQEENGATRIQVKFDQDTIWLSQRQMADLFDKDSDTIGLHLKNIYKSGELIEDPTTEYFSVVQKEGYRNVKRRIKFYNLDAIISVGYRVNSKKGTLFRIWATNVLREHLIKGYTQNAKRLSELKQSVKLIQGAVLNQQISEEQTKDIVTVLSDFALGLDVLDGYDNQDLEIVETEEKTKYQIDYQEAKKAIEELKLKYGGSKLFGNEKDDSFKGSINSINQTFEGKELYPSIEEKAAHLLYFIVKNHSFSDGNKRIAAWIFIWYLNRNGHLYNQFGRPRIENNALAALTLMIALSKPEEKDIIIRVIINLINKKNE